MAFDIVSMTPILAKVLMWGMIIYFACIVYIKFRVPIKKVAILVKRGSINIVKIVRKIKKKVDKDDRTNNPKQ